jgi:hypothetical protein
MLRVVSELNTSLPKRSWHGDIVCIVTFSFVHYSVIYIIPYTPCPLPFPLPSIFPSPLSSFLILNFATTKNDLPSYSDMPHSPHTCSSPSPSPRRPQAHASSAPDPYPLLYSGSRSFRHIPGCLRYHSQHHSYSSYAAPRSVTARWWTGGSGPRRKGVVARVGIQRCAFGGPSRLLRRVRR